MHKKVRWQHNLTYINVRLLSPCRNGFFPTFSTSDLVMGPAQLLEFGKERTEAVLKMHKDLLDAYQEASQGWVSRVKSEVELWSQLAAKLASSKSVPEGLEAYRDSISHRVQMAAEDGRRMFEEGQKFIATVTKSMSNGSWR